jgi:threonine/homoserine/homoserine lactone efflux protein
LSFATLGALSDSVYAVVAGTVADRLRGTQLIARIERWFGGSVLIGLGVTAAVFAPHRT